MTKCVVNAIIPEGSSFKTFSGYAFCGMDYEAGKTVSEDTIVKQITVGVSTTDMSDDTGTYAISVTSSEQSELEVASLIRQAEESGNPIPLHFSECTRSHLFQTNVMRGIHQVTCTFQKGTTIKDVVVFVVKAEGKKLSVTLISLFCDEEKEETRESLEEPVVVKKRGRTAK